VKLLLDAHISPKVSQALRREGFDALSVEEVGLKFAHGRALWEAAIDDARVFVTYDKEDFLDLYRELWFEGESHPGLVVVIGKSIALDDRGGQIRALRELLIADEELKDRVVYLCPVRS
jgi:predicted nuclease of predicted toxin-antitoxin system